MGRPWKGTFRFSKASIFRGPFLKIELSFCQVYIYFSGDVFVSFQGVNIYFWSNYSDLARPHLGWWNSLIWPDTLLDWTNFLFESRFGQQIFAETQSKWLWFFSVGRPVRPVEVRKLIRLVMIGSWWGVRYMVIYLTRKEWHLKQKTQSLCKEMCFVFNAPRCCSQTSNSVFFWRWELGISLDLRHAQKPRPLKRCLQNCMLTVGDPVQSDQDMRIFGRQMQFNMTQPHHGYSPCTVPLICFSVGRFWTWWKFPGGKIRTDWGNDGKNMNKSNSFDLP